MALSSQTYKKWPLDIGGTGQGEKFYGYANIIFSFNLFEGPVYINTHFLEIW